MYLDGSDNIAVSNHIIAGATAGGTALQPGASNTNLSNDAGYLTAYIETDPIASSNLTLHIDDPTAAHPASAISPTGSVYTTVQAWLSALGTMAYQASTNYLPLTGGTMTGNIDLGNHDLTGLDDIAFANNSGIFIAETQPERLYFISLNGGTSGYLTLDPPGAGNYLRNGYTWTLAGVLATQTFVVVDGTTITGAGTNGSPLAVNSSLFDSAGSAAAVSNVLAAADTSADRTPYLIEYASTVTVSRANGDVQRVAPLTGPCTILFPAGVTNYSSTISVEIPPTAGTNCTLATGPTYYYGDSLTGPSETNYVYALWQSAFGTTNATVRLYRGPQ